MDDAMVPKSLASVIISRAMLLAGLIAAVLLVWRNIAEVNRVRHGLAAEKQDYQSRLIAHEQCAAEIRKTGGFGDLLDVGIDARCPAKPSYREPTEAFAEYERSSRATTLLLAGLVLALTSLPWLASRWTGSRARPQIRA